MFKTTLKAPMGTHHIYNGRKSLLASYEDRDATHNLSPQVALD